MAGSLTGRTAPNGKAWNDEAIGALNTIGDVNKVLALPTSALKEMGFCGSFTKGKGLNVNNANILKAQKSVKRILDSRAFEAMGYVNKLLNRCVSWE